MWAERVVIRHGSIDKTLLKITRIQSANFFIFKLKYLFSHKKEYGRSTVLLDIQLGVHSGIPVSGQRA